ncbi:MAG: ABC transporter ATP-binding protein [Actinomycetia bacterium]|nr:ABC transporter ATP-binding protein [Actinomycetes bacterium]
MTETLVHIENVNRAFGDVLALEDVSIEIAENEFFALLGPSGCGKTTLLRTLAGFEQPDSGSVLLGGTDLLAMPAHRRPVNLMFQSYALFPHMSVERNVAYGLAREKAPKGEIRTRVAEVLETVGLTDKAGSRPHQLSGGQRQRVALARAIVKRPKVLLLDEPLSALDRKVRAQMQIELKRLQQDVGITFVVVTHDQEEAMSMADRIAVMSDGRVQQVDSPIDLYRRPANRFVADFIGSSNVFDGTWSNDRIEVDEYGALPGSQVSALVNGPAHLVVRPEHTTVVAPGDGILRGKVVEQQFLGGMSTLVIDVPGRATPLLSSQMGLPPVDRDGDVGITWREQDAVVVSGDSQ